MSYGITPGTWNEVHPSPKVMADFSWHKNDHDALIKFVQFLVVA